MTTSNFELPRTASAPLPDAALERQARRRAGLKLGWYIHASAYVLVNLFLVVLAVSRGHDWAMYPLLGWGLGLAIHGAVVFVFSTGGGFYERLLARERKALGGDRW